MCNPSIECLCYQKMLEEFHYCPLKKDAKTIKNLSRFWELFWFEKGVVYFLDHIKFKVSFWLTCACTSWKSTILFFLNFWPWRLKITFYQLLIQYCLRKEIFMAFYDAFGSIHLVSNESLCFWLCSLCIQSSLEKLFKWPQLRKIQISLCVSTLFFLVCHRVYDPDFFVHHQQIDAHHLALGWRVHCGCWLGWSSPSYFQWYAPFFILSLGKKGFAFDVPTRFL